MTRRGVKVGTCSLLFFSYATWQAVPIRATCSSQLFDPDVLLVALNCTYINNTRHMIKRVAVGAKGIAPSLDAQPQRITCSSWQQIPQAEQEAFIPIEIIAPDTNRISCSGASCQYGRSSGERCRRAATYCESYAGGPPRFRECLLMTGTRTYD